MRYRINFVKSSEVDNNRPEILEHLGFIFKNLSYIILFVVIGFTAHKLYHFHNVLQNEKNSLQRLTNYSAKNKTNSPNISYSALKELQNLESGQIYWSKYLDTLLTLLPPKFRVTHLTYNTDSLILSGIGHVSKSIDPIDPVQKLTNNLNQKPQIQQNVTPLTLNSFSIKAKPVYNLIQFSLISSRK